MSKYFDDTTAASDPVQIKLDPKKLKRFRKEYGWLHRKHTNRLPDDYLQEHLHNGDSRAAMVMKIDQTHIFVAAYTDELDAVAILKFNIKTVRIKNLTVGTRLLTINSYRYGNEIEKDLVEGPKTYQRYANFHPIIAEFLSSDMTVIDSRKASISESEWNRVNELGLEAISREIPPRLGNPNFSEFSYPS